MPPAPVPPGPDIWTGFRSETFATPPVVAAAESPSQIPVSITGEVFDQWGAAVPAYTKEEKNAWDNAIAFVEGLNAKIKPKEGPMSTNTYVQTQSGGYLRTADGTIYQFGPNIEHLLLQLEGDHLPMDAIKRDVKIPFSDLIEDPDAFTVVQSQGAPSRLVAVRATPGMEYRAKDKVERGAGGRFESKPNWKPIAVWTEPVLTEQAFRQVADKDSSLTERRAALSEPDYAAQAARLSEELSAPTPLLRGSVTPTPAPAPEMRFIRCEEHSAPSERVAANRILTSVSSDEILRSVIDVLEVEPLDTDSPLRNAVCNALTLVLHRYPKGVS